MRAYVVVALSLAACAARVKAPPPPVAIEDAGPSDAGDASADADAMPPPPAPTVLAHGLGVVQAMAKDDAFVYIGRAHGTIVRVPIAGGDPAPVATFDAANDIMALVPTPEGLYVATARGGEAAMKKNKFGDGAIMLVPASGKPRKIATGFAMPLSMVVDDTSVRWTGVKATGKKSAWVVFSVPRPKGGATKITKIDGDFTMAKIFGEYQHAGLVAWALGGLFLRPFGAGANGPTIAAVSQVSAASIDGDRIAIAGPSMDGNAIANVIGVTSLAGEHVLDRVAVLGEDDHIGDVALSGDDVFYTQVGHSKAHYKDGSVVRISIKDKKTTVLASDQFQPAQIFATPNGVIWLNEGGHTVMEDGTSELLFLAR